MRLWVGHQVMLLLLLLQGGKNLGGWMGLVWQQQWLKEEGMQRCKGLGGWMGMVFMVWQQQWVKGRECRQVIRAWVCGWGWCNSNRCYRRRECRGVRAWLGGWGWCGSNSG